MMSKYVATRRFHVGGGKFVEAGELIPGAEEWSTLHSHIRLGWIRIAYEEDLPPEPTPPKKPRGRPKKEG